MNLMQLSALGIQLAVSILVCTFGGFWLDRWLDSSPLLLIVGAFLGVGAGMWHAVREVDRVLPRRGRSAEPPDEPPQP